MARQVYLVFWLKEDVTPELFAEKIANACAKGGAIRKDEGVSFGSGIYHYRGDVEVDLFDDGKPITVPKLVRTDW